MWSGQALSQFGAQITELAIPVLAVLMLNATELEVGVLNAANVAAFLVVGLPAGAWIDRMRKRHVMIVADLVRAVALASLPAAVAGSARCRCGTSTSSRCRRASRRCSSTCRTRASSRRSCDRLRSPRRTASCSRPNELANIAGPASADGSSASSPHRRDPRHRRHIPRLVRRAPVHPRPRAAARSRGARAARAGDRRGTEVGVRQSAAAPHRRHDRHRRTSSAWSPTPCCRSSSCASSGSARRRSASIFSLASVGGLARRDRHAAHRRADRRGPRDPDQRDRVQRRAALRAGRSRSCRPSPSRCWWCRLHRSFTVLLYNITQVTFRQRITPPACSGA